MPDADNEGTEHDGSVTFAGERTENEYAVRAKQVYQHYAIAYKKRFKWLPSSLFIARLRKDLLSDARALIAILKDCGDWDAQRDAKLATLIDLITVRHPNQKVLVFTQFADTVAYLDAQLQARGVRDIAGVTGQSSDPTELAWRFSPVSNHKNVGDNELRVLIATDVLSEGQNLQDCAIIVNYDLPWAIIRLIQRAGRVDRIGQQATEIVCYSFLPADGVERIIRLRDRVRQRLQEAAEVVGTDEAFFDDDGNNKVVIDLYNETAGILDGDADTEVDLASHAYQIWKNATDRDPSLLKTIPALPPVVYSTRAHTATAAAPNGVLLYMRSTDGTDSLAWIDQHGTSVSQSQWAILQAAACEPNTPTIPRHPDHHHLVSVGVKHIANETSSAGGTLGRPSGARFRTYERLRRYEEAFRGTLLEVPELAKAIDEIFRFPLRQNAIDTLNRQLRSGIDDQRLAELVMGLREDDRLCIVDENDNVHEPQIICSMGLFPLDERT